MAQDSDKRVNLRALRTGAEQHKAKVQATKDADEKLQRQALEAAKALQERNDPVTFRSYGEHLVEDSTGRVVDTSTGRVVREGRPTLDADAFNRLFMDMGGGDSTSMEFVRNARPFRISPNPNVSVQMVNDEIVSAQISIDAPRNEIPMLSIDSLVPPQDRNREGITYSDELRSQILDAMHQAFVDAGNEDAGLRRVLELYVNSPQLPFLADVDLSRGNSAQTSASTYNIPPPTASELLASIERARDELNLRSQEPPRPDWKQRIRDHVCRSTGAAFVSTQIERPRGHLLRVLPAADGEYHDLVGVGGLPAPTRVAVRPENYPIGDFELVGIYPSCGIYLYMHPDNHRLVAIDHWGRVARAMLINGLQDFEIGQLRSA